MAISRKGFSGLPRKEEGGIAVRSDERTDVLSQNDDDGGAARRAADAARAQAEMQELARIEAAKAEAVKNAARTAAEARRQKEEADRIASEQREANRRAAEQAEMARKEREDNEAAARRSMELQAAARAREGEEELRRRQAEKDAAEESRSQEILRREELSAAAKRRDEEERQREAKRKSDEEEERKTNELSAAAKRRDEEDQKKQDSAEISIVAKRLDATPGETKEEKIIIPSEKVEEASSFANSPIVKGALAAAGATVAAIGVKAIVNEMQKANSADDYKKIANSEEMKTTVATAKNDVRGIAQSYGVNTSQPLPYIIKDLNGRVEAGSSDAKAIKTAAVAIAVDKKVTAAAESGGSNKTLIFGALALTGLAIYALKKK